MNFLAHIYLSGDDDRQLKLGNFMADSIKGKAYKTYPLSYQKGILLHRKIDSFSDTHPETFKSKHRLFPEFRHYSGVIVDVLYDHFLAKHWNRYHPQNLKTYVDDFYQSMADNFDDLPPNVQRFYPVMVRENWLYNYRTIEGIQHILQQMSRRLKHSVQLDKAIPNFKHNYTRYQAEFSTFFEAIRLYCAEEKVKLNTLNAATNL